MSRKCFFSKACRSLLQSWANQTCGQCSTASLARILLWQKQIIGCFSSNQAAVGGSARDASSGGGNDSPSNAHTALLREMEQSRQERGDALLDWNATSERAFLCACMTETPETFPCAVFLNLCEVVTCTLRCPRNGAVNSMGALSTWPAVPACRPRWFRKKWRGSTPFACLLSVLQTEASASTVLPCLFFSEIRQHEYRAKAGGMAKCQRPTSAYKRLHRQLATTCTRSRL